ncbi:DUF1707 domain-containing protein [Streptomyces xiamenensis]|uniref:DUF1707 SHOCT-like domain-containing protein n=1 Tax=Streptomyces xiamenensis TaxID=408015 RepID=UPI00369FC05B
MTERRSQDELRASHADRDIVVERLREAAGEGRLDLDELEERLERALTARTYGELAALTTDLPGPAAPTPATAPAPLAPRPAARPVPAELTVKGGMGGAERTGHWRAPAKIIARGGMGGVKLDFTQAELSALETEVEIHGGMSGVTLVVPAGWAIDATDFEEDLGGLKNKTEHVVPDERTPGLRLTGNGGMGGVVVRHPNLWERRRLRENPS